MKRYIKGLITGLLIGAAVTAIPAVAENIDALFNEVRININGVDKVQWGESITLSDGTQTPYSILYNGTTYLPLRKTAELLGKEAYWNGDSKTVSVVDEGRTKTFIAEKPDKNGNVWKYSTVETADGNYYLLVEDKQRGFTRAYRMMDKSIRITDESIYFSLRMSVSDGWPTNAHLVRMDFMNDESTQDGEVLYNIEMLDPPNNKSVIFDGDYVYYIMSYSRANVLRAHNYMTGELIQCELNIRNLSTAYNLQLKSSDENTAVLGYTLSASSYIDTPEREITFYKTIKEFDDSVKTLK